MVLVKRRARRVQKKKVHSPVRAAMQLNYLACAKKGRSTFLLATALGTGLLALTMGPKPALAACTISSNQTTVSGNRDVLFGPALGRNCNNTTTVNTGVVVTGHGVGAVGVAPILGGNPNATVNNNGTVSSTDASNQNGVDARSFGVSLGTLNLRLGDAIYNGSATANVNGAHTGINVEGGNATANVLGGSVTGRDGDGINASSFGIQAAIDLGIVTVDVNQGGTTLVNTSGNTSVLGSANGINASAISVGLDPDLSGRPASVTVNANGSGGVTGTNGAGINAIALAGAINGTPSATTTVRGSSNIFGNTAGVNAISASINGNATTTVELGSDYGPGGNGNVSGQSGIVAIAASADLDLDDLGSIDLSDPSTLPVGDGKATVNVHTTGRVVGTNGTGITAIGIGTGNDVDVRAEGQVVGTNGFGVLAGSIGENGDVDVRTSDVRGTQGGVLGFNLGGDATVTTNGLVEVAPGGLIGVGAISNGGDATVRFNGIIDPPLIGAGTLAIGNGTALTDTTGSIDADLIGAIAVNIGDGRAVVDNKATVHSSVGTSPLLGVGAIKIGDGNASADPDVVVENQGAVSDFEIGVLGLAAGDNNQVEVDNQAAVDAGLLGVGGVIIGDGGAVNVHTNGAVQATGAGVVGAIFGDNGTVTVETRAAVEGDALGVGGFVVGDNNVVTIDTHDTVQAVNGFGVAGLGVGDNNSFNVETHENVEGDLLGVGALNFGNDSDVTILTREHVVSGSGFGVLGGAIGDTGNNTVNIETRDQVEGELLGVGGIIGGDNSNLDIVTQARVDSASGFGVAGLGFGDTNTIDVTTRGEVTGDLLGVGALNFGNGAAVTVLTEDTVTSASGFGVFGGAIGDTGGNTVSVTTLDVVHGELLGVGGIIGGDNSELTIVTEERVTSNGFGVAGLGFGDNNAINVTTEETVDGDLLGVGALNFGGGIVNVTTEKAVTSDEGFGVLGGTLGGSTPGLVTVLTKDTVDGALLGVGGLTGSDNSVLSITTEKAVTSSEGFGVFGLGLGGDGSSITVETLDTVSGELLGVGGVQIGDNADVNVTSQAAVTSASGIGVLGGAIGTGGTVDVVANGTVTAGFAGVVAFNTGGDATATNNDKVSVDGGLVGVFAFAGGAGNAVANINAEVDPPIIGGGAFTIGSGDATTNVNALVQATDIGILGGNIGTGDVFVTVNPTGAIESDGIGIQGFKLGDGNTTISVDGAIRGDTTADGATGGDGINVFNSLGAGLVSVTTLSGGTIDAGDDGISINKYLSNGDVNGKAVVVTTNAAINAGGDGIEITHVGGSGDIDVTTNAAINADENGIEIIKILGTGNVNVAVNDDILAGEDGVFAFSGATIGDIVINQAGSTSITANDDGIQAVSALNAGTTVVNTGSFSSIEAGDDGISVIKVLGLGSAEVTTGSFSYINAGDDGIQVTSVLDVDLTGFETIDVDTGFASLIVAGDDGIEVTQALSGGNVNVNTGTFSAIVAGDDGINASSYASIGNVNVTTGFGSAIFAENDGIVAEAYLGFGAGGVGDVSVETGAYSLIVAGDDGITAINYNLGFGNGATVDTGYRSVTLADDKGVRAGGWDQVIVNVGEESVLVGGLDTTTDGNAIRIFDADLAVVNVGEGALVVGSGAGWGSAVISVESEDATYINIDDDALVTSRSLFGVDGLAAAAADLVIDADGAAADIDNWGTLVGRVALTGNDDTLNNFSSFTWYVSGNNYFGDGNDLVNNEGRTVTAFDGAAPEVTNFFDLETFRNGDATGGQAGLLSMLDNDTGGFNAIRDVTYTSGVFEGVSAGPLGTYGNSTLAVDAFLGGPGSTSDVLVVGGLDIDGNPIDGQTTLGTTEIYVNDVNGGPGAFNLDGILVVNVENGDTYGKYNNGGNAPNFVISPDTLNYDSKFGGVIDKGLFFYDIVTMPEGDGTGHFLIGLPDEEVFQLPSLITGAQNIWHDTTGVWLDRQVDLRSYLLNPVPVGPPVTIVSKEQGLITKAPAAVAAPNVTPGVWGKALGSWASRDANRSYSILGNTYGYDTGYDQDTYGFIAGADFGKTDVDSAWVFGVLGGYINSKMNFNSAGTSAEYTGGTVGGYVTYLNGGFFIDGLVKADFLSLDFDAPTLGGMGYYGESTDVTNIGFVIDTGYRIPWTGTVWFEPVATLSYVNTQIDNLNEIPDATVKFEDGDSLRGALGARIGGRVYDAATYWVEASATGRFWYEFEGNNQAWVLNPGDDFTAFDNFDGGFGEITGSLNVFGKDNGWNGFLNGSYLFNGDYNNGSAKVGVRYQW